MHTPPQTLPAKLPVLWSIAGTDSGGGAGLSADQRAADAMGVHLCPVVAAVTAQSTVAVHQVHAIPPELLDAQLAALAADLPPRAIKTGLLGSAANVLVVANWVDRLRKAGPVDLVIDPVLRASTGASVASADVLQAIQRVLLPRATAITPNRQEAQALLGPTAVPGSVAAMAAALRARGAGAVCITGGDACDTLANDWLDTAHASGWLSLPRVPTPHHHGTGCTYASALAAALASGFVAADAAVLAKMATTHALRHARAVGQGAGPVIAMPGFATDPTLLPQLSLDETVPRAWSTRERAVDPGVYAIVDSAERAKAVLSLRPTVSTIQLRMKRPDGVAAGDPAWLAGLREAMRQSLAAADAAGATLYINDHWREALEAGARALHLGQEDLLALGREDRMQLQAARAQGVRLGLSSHSLWELCRAHACQPDYIACGPVWPTSTKAMPWQPQGLDNLAWWAHMSPAPVVGIGGVIEPVQLRHVAASGAAGGCVVRGLGDVPAATLPNWLAAWDDGRALRDGRRCPALPHPCL